MNMNLLAATVSRLDEYQELTAAMDDILCQRKITEGTLRDRMTGAVRQYHIGGEGHEA